MRDVSIVIPMLELHSANPQPAISSALAGNRSNGLSTQIVAIIDNPKVIRDEEAYPLTCFDMGGVRYFNTLRAGVCHARNLGIQLSTFNELCLPLDDDDELLPDGLQALVDAWQPGTLVYGGWIEGDEYKSPAPPEMLNRKNVAHATWLFHKDDWRRVGGYDPDFNIGGEDWAFMVALVAAGVRAVRIDTPIYRKAVREGSRTDQARSRFPFIKQLLREKYPAVMG
jgi:glycosyltransferase involved in cell wall biosynthesis